MLLMTTALAAVSAYLWWGFRVLPGERWQILATVPIRKSGPDNEWSGINLTWYGLLSANAYLAAVVVLLVLLGSVGVSPEVVAVLTTALLLCCVPASRLVARIVERKAHTFTVGGATFVGLLIAPPLILLLNQTIGARYAFHLPLTAACAALAIAYSFGEGLGRLACISFGCCYGRPLSTVSGFYATLFRGRGFRFSGGTKKIAYADNLEGVEVIPVQALTAVLYTACGLIAAVLFLHSRHGAAFLLVITVTQGWRTFSETLRADHRGEGNVSAYQIMGIIGILYAGALLPLAPVEFVAHVGVAGSLHALWRPDILLFLQAIWLTIFIYTGRSTVTGAQVRFHLHGDRV